MGITKSKVLLWLVGVVTLAIAAGAGYVWIALHWSYSSGERAGYIQKFSQKGWLCKTWEGELAMIPVPGSMPEKFLFTVRDDGIARKLNSSMGKKISVHYEQHKGVPTSCFGETEYYVTDVRVLE
jgi:hypothetical protein